MHRGDPPTESEKNCVFVCVCTWGWGGEYGLGLKGYLGFPMQTDGSYPTDREPNYSLVP